MLCRLCFFEFSEENAVSLFGDDGESNLIKLIAKYLYIEVVDHDNYPTNMCRKCFQNLNDFHNFFQHVEQRQKAFQNSLQDSTPLEEPLEPNKAEIASLNFDEALLDIKEINPTESDDHFEQLESQVEFAYADFEDKDEGDEAICKDSEDFDEDDEPLKNLISIKNTHETKRNAKTSKPVKVKKVITRRKQKPKCRKGISAKRRKDVMEDSNDNTKDLNTSIKQNKYSCTPEEDKLRDELIAKHIDLKCEICGTCVSSYKDLKVHFRTEHNRKSFITCCGKRFTQRFLLVDHINSHLNPDHFKCELCGKVFKSRICVGVHMANKHSDRNQLRHGCDICGKRFSHQSILTTHMLVHTQERNHVCKVCKKGFKSSHMLKAHTRHMHGEKTPYVCDTCGKEYRFKLSFDRHVAEHQGQTDEQQQCPTCGKWFSPNYLRRHVKRHDLLDVDCEKCGKTFKSKAALTGHMEYSHRPKRTYACTFCDKTFDRALNLKEHIDMHTGTKAYNCAHCPREFRSKANMYAHVKKMHYEQWVKAQCTRNRAPNDATNSSNEIKTIVES